jgi:hypothetical protein
VAGSFRGAHHDNCQEVRDEYASGQGIKLSHERIYQKIRELLDQARQKSLKRAGFSSV